jgi:lipid-A-disaccharide synthase
MLGAARLLEARVPGVQFVCPVASTVDLASLKTQSDSLGLPVRFHQGCIYDVYAIATAAVIASGTATLEAALAGVPMVVVYKVAPLTYAIFKRLVTIAHISLPNIVAGRAIVRELLQEAANAARIAEEVVALLESPEQQEQMRADLAEVAERLGPPGAASRAAQVVVSVGEETL